MTNNYTENEKVKDNVWIIAFADKNLINETLLIELCKCKNSGKQNALPEIWYEKGYTNTILSNYWCVSTYVTDSEGREHSAYNPQHKNSSEINFDWMMEATEKNKERLINEIYRLFSSATGKTATEKKIGKIIRIANEKKIEVVTEIPNGWIKKHMQTDPDGAISVCNMKPSINTLRDETYCRKLLLDF